MKVIDTIRPEVVNRGNSLIGAPFIQVEEYPLMRKQWLDLGTDPEKGLDCSGFVIHCITKALKSRPMQGWSEWIRTSQDMADAVYGEDASLPLLVPKSAKPADVIVWLESGLAVSHAALVKEVTPSGEITYLHSTKYADKNAGACVTEDTLRMNDWAYPVLLPLEKLISHGVGGRSE